MKVGDYVYHNDDVCKITYISEGNVVLVVLDSITTIRIDTLVKVNLGDLLVYRKLGWTTR